MSATHTARNDHASQATAHPTDSLIFFCAPSVTTLLYERIVFGSFQQTLRAETHSEPQKNFPCSLSIFCRPDGEPHQRQIHTRSLTPARRTRPLALPGEVDGQHGAPRVESLPIFGLWLGIGA